MKVKFVNRYSPKERLFRLFRVMWDGKYPDVPSRKLSFAVTLRGDRWLPGLFRNRNDDLCNRRWYLVLLPCCVIRIHYAKSYGGRFV